METGTQTEHLLTIPLEVLAVSCITYNMIDKIRDVLQQAERDLWQLLFGNRIPDSVLGRPPNPPPTSPPSTSPSSHSLPLTKEESSPATSTSHNDDTLLSYLPPSSVDYTTNITPRLSDLSGLQTLKSVVESSGAAQINNLVGQETVDLGIQTQRALTEVKVGQNTLASVPFKRKRDEVTSSEGARNGKSGKRVKQQNGKKGNNDIYTEVQIKEEPVTVTDPSTTIQYRCEQCRAEFSCPDRLARHVTMIHSSRSFDAVGQPAAPNIHQCIICNQTFSNNTVLREHQLKHHRHSAVLGAGLICNICGKCSTDRGSFEEHMKKHTINKNFRCHVCYKGFSQNENLLQHLRVIHNVKERKCAN